MRLFYLFLSVQELLHHYFLLKGTESLPLVPAWDSRIPFLQLLYVSPEKRQALQMSSLNLCISFISGAKIVNIVESTIIYQLIKYCTAILFRGYYL